MTTAENVHTRADTVAQAPPTPLANIPRVRPLYWSLRRELWENRSLVAAPLATAGLVLAGYVLGTVGLPHRRRALLLLDPAKRHAAAVMPYDAAASVVCIVAMLVGAFYCLDALHGERRDRSLLFWKSLPVSDRTAVLAKACVPLVVLPAIALALVLVVQVLMMLWTAFLLVASGLGLGAWIPIDFLVNVVVLVYGVLAMAFWHAPLYGWFLLVSGWARRAPFLWAVLPPVVLALVERFANNTTHVSRFLQDRVVGVYGVAFTPDAQGNIDSLAQLAPGRLLAAPGLWLGLIVFAFCVAGAVRLRRARAPL
jgi:ABC-2 type transport system permease protein